MTAFTCQMCKAEIGVRQVAGQCPKCGARYSPDGVWRWLQHLPITIVLTGLLLVGPIIQAITKRPFGISDYAILLFAVVILSTASSVYVLRNARHKWAVR